MNILTAIAAGIGGTAVMTAFIYLLSYTTKKRLKVVKILGTMLTFQTTPDKQTSEHSSAIVVGIIGHYLVGIIFSVIYYLLWTHGIGKPDLMTCAIYGFISGIVGIIVWRIFFVLHPNPPAVPLKDYIVSILIGHIFFGAGVWLTIQLLT
jgi:uncharacterized membrane protein YagU involved in acid resistance